MVNRLDQSQFLSVVLLLCIYPYVQSKFNEKTSRESLETSLEEHDVYSSLKANEFLSYEKCMQRMKCSVNHKEDCSEECHRGNTEEEIEEHQELILNERSTTKRKSKADGSANQATSKTTNSVKTEF